MIEFSSTGICETTKCCGHKWSVSGNGGKSHLKSNRFTIIIRRQGIRVRCARAFIFCPHRPRRPNIIIIIMLECVHKKAIQLPSGSPLQSHFTYEVYSVYVRLWYVYLFKGVTASGIKIHKSLGIHRNGQFNFPLQAAGRVSTHFNAARWRWNRLFTDYECMTSVRRWRRQRERCLFFRVNREPMAVHLPSAMPTKIYYFSSKSKSKELLIYLVSACDSHSNLPVQQTQQLWRSRWRKCRYSTPLRYFHGVIY